MKKTLWILSVLLCLCVILFVFAACGGGNDDTTEAPVTEAQVLFDLNGGSSPSAVASKTVTELNASDFFFDVTKSGFNFRGWTYNGVTVFDENGNLVNEVALSPTMSFVAKWSDKAKLTIVSDMPEAGEISPAGEYEYNTEVGVFAHPHQGYEFVGWFYQNALLSRQEEYNYKMWDRDVTLTARFQLAHFTLSLTSNDSDLGLVLINPTGTALDLYEEEKESSILYTKQTTIAAYTKTDVRFLGWFDEDGTLVATNAVYTFVMPNHDYALTAKWNRFRVTYDLDGGINAESNPETYAVEDEVTLAAPTRTGYTFAGWSDGGKIAKGSTGTKTFTANWTSSGLDYKSNGNGTCSVSGIGSFTGTDLIIPSVSSTGDRVTSVGDNAFRDRTGLTSITIPDSVTSIGNSAFSGCSGLTSVTIGNGVKSIGNYAFSDCTGLTSVTIPNGVTRIGSSAFAYCTGLTAVTIGNSVTSIGNYAFSFCSGLTSITIPDSVTSIGQYAFSGCSGLTSITIPDSVTSIGGDAFYNCTGLTSVTIGNSVTSIGWYAFYGCTGLTTVTFKNTSGWYVTKTSGASSGTNVTVTNASTNATNLKSTYMDYYWYRK